MADRIASVVRLHSGAARHLKLEFFVASLVAKNLVVAALPMMTAGFAAVVAQMSLVVEAYALSVDVAAYLRHWIKIQVIAAVVAAVVIVEALICYFECQTAVADVKKYSADSINVVAVACLKDYSVELEVSVVVVAFL